MKNFISAFVFVSIWSSNLLAQAPSIEWQQCLGGPSQDGGKRVIQSTDGNYLIVGNANANGGNVTGHHGNSDIWLVKFSSSGGFLWQKAIGGTQSDGGFSIKERANGNIVLLGVTESSDGDIQSTHGGSDVWLVELNSSGSVVNSQTFGGSSSDGGSALETTQDGGLVLFGGSSSTDGDLTFTHGGTDWWVLKLSASNTIQWQKTFGGSNDEFPYHMKKALDGGYIGAGVTNSIGGDISSIHGGRDFWVVKLDSIGNLQWEKTFGGTATEYANSISTTSDGGYIVSGYTSSNNGDVSLNHGYIDAWLIKIDDMGNLEWEKTYGGSGTDGIYQAEQTSDGGYLFVGSTDSHDGDIDSTLVHGGFDQWLVKTDSLGNIVWQDWVGGSLWEEAYGFAQTSDGRLVTVGYTESSDGNVSCSTPLSSEMFIVKYAQLTEMNQLIDPSNFSVFPNPTNGKLFLSHLPHGVRVSIFDSMGQLSHDLYPDDPDLSLDLSANPSGIFHLRVENKGKIISRQVVLQR